MKKWLLNLALVAAFPIGIVLLDGCYPQDSISVSETDIVLVNYNDSVGFTTLKTYFMSDTVYPVRDDTTDHSLIENNDLIIQTIEDNMTAYGYTRIYAGDEQVPDVRVNAAAIAVTTVSVGWWYPYYPGWGWGWGWYKSSRDTDYYYYPPGYYPPYWGYPTYSSYTTGTLLMEMANPLDIEIIEGDTVVPIYWRGIVNGVLSSGSNASRVSSGIDKAFELSPEIKTN